MTKEKVAKIIRFANLEEKLFQNLNREAITREKFDCLSKKLGLSKIEKNRYWILIDKSFNDFKIVAAALRVVIAVLPERFSKNIKKEEK